MMSGLGKRWKSIIFYIHITIFLLSSFAFAEDLHEAVKEGNLDKVKRLIGEGANVNAVDKTGYTALWRAESGGFKDIMDLLIKHGGRK
jgi:ankyrin repeat protein